MNTNDKKVFENHHNTTPKPTPILTKHRDVSNLSKPKRSDRNSIKKQIDTNDNKVFENHNDTTTRTTDTDTDTGP